MDNGFPKSNRLRTKSDFKCLKDNSRIYRDKYLNLYYSKSSESGINSKMGLAISRKCGNSVNRNFLKRTIREFFRKSSFKNEGYSFLVNTKPALRQLEKKEVKLIIEKSLETIFCKLTSSNS